MMDYAAHMNGLMAAPYDPNECIECGGSGAMAVMCCPGRECGCHGLPTEFTECNLCDRPFPKEEQIANWLASVQPERAQTGQESTDG